VSTVEQVSYSTGKRGYVKRPGGKGKVSSLRARAWLEIPREGREKQRGSEQQRGIVFTQYGPE